MVNHSSVRSDLYPLECVLALPSHQQNLHTDPEHHVTALLASLLCAPGKSECRVSIWGSKSPVWELYK